MPPSSRFLNLIRTVCCGMLLILISAETGNTRMPSDVQTIRTIGTAGIYRDNVAAAREEAISDALAGAVDMAVIHLLSIESLVRNFETANDILQGQTGTFIQGYQVLAEQRLGNAYRVVVQATLSAAALAEQFSNAGIVLGGKAMPTILFLMAESDVEGNVLRYWWGEDLPYFIPIAQRAISEIFKRKGFIVLDPAGMIAAGTMDIGTDKPDPDTAEAAHIGARLGADVVILGKSSVERTANVMGARIRSFEATVAVRALETETGAEIGVAVQSAVAAKEDDAEGSTEAMTKAGTLAGETLSKQIASAWEKGFQAPTSIRIIVEGTRNLINFVLFRKMLSGISGVESIKTRDMKPDTATVTAGYTGTPKQLAEALMLKTVENFGLNITEVSEDHLRVEIVSKSR